MGKCILSSDLQDEAQYPGTIQWVLSNKPSTVGKNQITQIQNPRGSGYIRTLGESDKSLRPNTSKDRARNNLLKNTEEIEVIAMDNSKKSSEV